MHQPGKYITSAYETTQPALHRPPLPTAAGHHLARPVIDVATSCCFNCFCCNEPSAAQLCQLTPTLDCTATHTITNMLARRACTRTLGSFSASQAFAVRSRSFAAAAAVQCPKRAPALADITPDSAASFNKKQQEFRQSLITAQKQKEQKESASCPSIHIYCTP